MVFRMLAGYSLLFAILTAVICKEAWKKYYVAAKSVNSLGFLVTFSIAGYYSGEVWQYWLMLPAFICCFIGDILMAEYNRYRKKIHFKLGLIIFLMGHLCFVRWLCRLQPMELTDLILPGAAAALAWYLTSLTQIHTGRLRPFILMYAVFVALFLSKALHLAIVRFSPAALMIAAGSLLFFVSDVSILFLYFYKKRGPGIHIFNVATYYYGVFLLSISLLFV